MYFDKSNWNALPHDRQGARDQTTTALQAATVRTLVSA